MPTASASTAAASSVHAHQRPTAAAAHGSHRANADKGASSPFSMLVDAASAPELPPRPEAPSRDAGARDTDSPRGRDQTSAAGESDPAAETAPDPQSAGQANASPAETSLQDTGLPIVAGGDADTPDMTAMEDADALLMDSGEQAAVASPTAGEIDPAAAMSAVPVPVPPTPPIPPAAAIAIPLLASEAPAPTNSPGAEQIAGASEPAPAAAASNIAPMPIAPELARLAGKDGEKADKSGDKTADAKASGPATSHQPAPPDGGKPTDGAAMPSAKVAPAAGDGDKPADAAPPAQPAAHEKPLRQIADPAADARTADRTTATTNDTRLSGLHLVSGTGSQEAVQAAVASTPATPAAAAAQIVNREMVGTPVPLASVAVEIAARAQAGSNHFEIRLDPPELGRIDVRLDVDRHGNVTSRLIADRGDTLDLLRREAPQLERALQDAGLKTSDNGLQFSLRDQGTGADRNARQTPNPAAAPAEAAEPEPLPAEALRSYRWSGVAGGVDIRV